MLNFLVIKPLLRAFGVSVPGRETQQTGKVGYIYGVLAALVLLVTEFGLFGFGFSHLPGLLVGLLILYLSGVLHKGPVKDLFNGVKDGFVRPVGETATVPVPRAATMPTASPSSIPTSGRTRAQAPSREQELQSVEPVMSVPKLTALQLARQGVQGSVTRVDPRAKFAARIEEQKARLQHAANI